MSNQHQEQEQIMKQQVAQPMPQQVQQPMPEQPSQVCGPMWSEGPMYSVSLTNLGNFHGAPEPVHECGSTLQGAKFMKVKHMYSPRYERLVTEIMPVPWIAEPDEATFLNRIKAANEPKVETYKRLHLEAMPDNNYGSFQTEGFSSEGFGTGGYDLFFKVLLIICLLAFIYYVSKEMK